MKLFLILALTTLPARAEILHPGYCSPFETSHGCEEIHPAPSYDTQCSCPGQPPAPPKPANGVRCGFPNHMTGDRYCCDYTNGVMGRCWTQ